MKTNSFLSKINRLAAVFALVFAGFALNAQVAIVSSDSGPGLRTAMAWPPFSGAAGYQIYRKTSLAATYPSTPVNPAPIAPIANCTAVRSLLLFPDSTAWKIAQRALRDSTALFDPCNIASIAPASPKYAALLQIASRNLAIAKTAGLAYEDGSVTNGQAYWYRIEAVNAAGNPIGVVANDLNVTAGVVTLPPAPAGLVAEAGDNDVLLHWDDAPGAAGYHLYRSIAPNGLYQQVSETPYSARLKNKLNGDTLLPAKYGFLDYQRWDSTGTPVPHLVEGASINGPFNGYTYYYKIKSVDLLGRTGPMSAVFASAMPTDKTIPAVPAGLSTIPDETSANGSVEIRWLHVTNDANGHREMPGVVQYKLYRFETSVGNPDSLPSVQVTGAPIAAPGGTGNVQMVVTTDNSPNLRAQYGDKTWWYRVKAVDNAGNESRWSAAFSAVLKDITKPNIPTGVVAEGFEDRIELRWAANSDPDLQGYQVYRSFCHYGEWVPCPEPEPPVDPNCPPCKRDEGRKKEAEVPTPCSGPFVFLGEITKDSLSRAIAAGHAAFADRTIPTGSPVCYAYWIKAADKSGNRSGEPLFPSPAERTQIPCERLRDKTPPEPALISGLFARDRAVRVEWIAPPTPDTRAYHVYRAEEASPQVEPSPSDFKWVGGMTVEKAPTLPVSLSAPYRPMGLSTCDVIPVEATEQMSTGFLMDRGVEKHKVYWYKVVGIDFDGNEGALKNAVAVSTFTFETKPGAAPLIETIAQQPDTCGIRLQWLPAFDPKEHHGFLLYKGMEESGPFVQVTSLLAENSYLDKQVVKGRRYWYKLAIVRRDGKLTEITTAAVAQINP
jgi:fibronectin type 3 domain-containing protein